MYSKAALSSIGLPHSGHSGGVRGRSALSMVFSTSTKGTCVTIALQSSGAWFTTAPIRVPPALAPEMTILPSDPYPLSIRCPATSTKSLKVLVRSNSLPASYQWYPRSSPPRIWAMANMKPRSSRDSLAVEKDGEMALPYAP